MSIREYLVRNRLHTLFSALGKRRLGESILMFARQLDER